MKISRAIRQYLNFWIAHNLIFVAVLSFHQAVYALNRIVVKDYPWVRKIAYKDSIILISKLGSVKQIAFLRNGKKILYRETKGGRINFDFESFDRNQDHKIFVKKEKSFTKVGYLKKKGTKYFQDRAEQCSKAMRNAILGYQVKNFNKVQNFSVMTSMWSKSQCDLVAGDEGISEKLGEQFDAIATENWNATKNCFGSSSSAEKFVNDQSGLEFAFRFIAGFENVVSLLKNGSAPFEISCISKQGEPAGWLDRSQAIPVLSLNLYKIKEAKTDSERNSAMAEMAWTIFHEVGHRSLSLPPLPIGKVNCFDEGAVSNLVEFCQGNSKTNLSLTSVVNGCAAESRLENKNQQFADRREEQGAEGTGKADALTALAAQQDLQNIADSAQIAPQIAANTNPAIYTAVPEQAFDNLVGTTLATTGGNSLPLNQERPIISTPGFAQSVETVYQQMNTAMNGTAQVLARAIIPVAEATTNGSTYAVDSNKNIKPTSTVAVAKPANGVSPYSPAEYVTDLTCASTSCKVSPELERSYASAAAGIKTQYTLASGGSDGALTGGGSVNGPVVNGKATVAQQVDSAVGAQGKLTDSAVAGTVGGGPIAGSTTGGTTGSSAAGASPARGVASTASSKGSSPRMDSSALQMLATIADKGESATGNKIGGVYLEQIRKQYNNDDFRKQLDSRGWSITYFKKNGQVERIGATQGIKSAFEDKDNTLAPVTKGK